MNNLKADYKLYFSNKKFLSSLTVGFLMLILGLVLNFYAGIYATDSASNPVNDIILNNIPVFDVDLIFVYGPFIFWFFISILCLQKPQRIPFLLKSIALFLTIRSVFISMTHIGPFPDQIAITNGADIIKYFSFGGDLFFSAHTGLPFLMAMLFYKNKALRIFCILTAIFFGIIVLLAHRHYTIDVFSAFFITYAIYHIAERFFTPDQILFEKGVIV